MKWSVKGTSPFHESCACCLVKEKLFKELQSGSPLFARVQKLPFGSESKATGILLFPWTLALPEIPQSAAKKTRQKAGISFSCNKHQSGTTNGVFRLRGVCTCHASLVEHMNRSFPRSSLSKSAAFFRQGAEVWIVHPGIGLSQCKTLDTPEVGGLRGCLSNLWNQHYNMMCRPCVCV